MDLAHNPAVHAITDVTGFGLLGHGLEMARGSAARITIRADDLPVFAHAANLVQQGFVTGASERNWASYGSEVALPASFPKWRRQILTDPQTSGGLLIACAADHATCPARTITGSGYEAAPESSARSRPARLVSKSGHEQIREPSRFLLDLSTRA